MYLVKKCSSIYIYCTHSTKIYVFISLVHYMCHNSSRHFHLRNQKTTLWARRFDISQQTPQWSFLDYLQIQQGTLCIDSCELLSWLSSLTSLNSCRGSGPSIRAQNFIPCIQQSIRRAAKDVKIEQPHTFLSIYVHVEWVAVIWVNIRYGFSEKCFYQAFVHFLLLHQKWIKLGWVSLRAQDQSLLLYEASKLLRGV